MVKKGPLEGDLLALKLGGDNEWNFIDTTIVKAHQHASGAAKSTNEAEVIGKSVAGNATKIHKLADSNGNPVHFETSEVKSTTQDLQSH